MTRPDPKLLRFTFVALALAMASETNAAIFLTQNFSGTLAPGATLGGTPLADGTAISYSATFDPTPIDVPEGSGTALFSVTGFSLTIAGHGTYAVDPADWSVVLVDPSNAMFSGYYLAGLVRNYGEEEGSGGFFAGFPTATPSFDAADPVPTLFSTYLGTYGGDITIDLPGVTGGLGIGQFASVSSMSITAVPEPIETAFATGIALGAFAFLRLKRASAAR